jgi:hypothetical protein
MINSKKHFSPPRGVFTERKFDGHPGARAEVDNSDSVLFIFFCGKENEPKETARGPGPAGCPALLAAGGPCGTRLRSNSHRAFIAGRCDARPGTMGQKTPAQKTGLFPRSPSYGAQISAG